jgi:hypothetical protein
MAAAVRALHFFNWYRTSREAPLSELEKRWTFRPAWEAMGIAPEEIGTTQNYFRAQFERIRATGFDALLWEWHNPAPGHDALGEERAWPYRGGTPPAPALEAARQTGLRIGMFYDLEIRWAGLPRFLAPVRPVAEAIVRDVEAFYADLPADLHLTDRDGNLAMVFYGYQFAGGGAPQDWERFFTQVAGGLRQALGRTPAIHWTDAGAPEQAWAYQHVPSIRPFTFNPCHPQSAWGADSVTFCLGYDDYGVWRGNAAAPGPRTHDLIIDDPRLVEESLALARASDPSLVFFYGWNELYEGEGLIPDDVHGDARLELAAGILGALSGPAGQVPAPVVVCDDLLPLARRAPERAARQIALLRLLRPVLAGARCRLAGARPEAGPAVYLTEEAPPAEAPGAPRVWLAPPGTSTAVPGTTVCAQPDPAEAVFAAARALGLPVRGGVLFSPHWVRVSSEGVEDPGATAPTCLPPAALPVERVVLAAARALPEHALRLPTGWGAPGFRWLRGTPREIAVEEGCVRLRHPEVIEARRI